MKTFDIVVALDSKRGIGKHNSLPWKLSGDLKYFKQVTSDAADGKRNAVIMGRKTWESIPEKRRPLAGRQNVVLTWQAHYELSEGVLKAGDLNEALDLLDGDETIDKLFVIGGAQVYDQAIKHPRCQRLYVTEIEAQFDCDRFLGQFPERFTVQSRRESEPEGEVRYAFVVYESELVVAPPLVVGQK